jgi:hypothetical protein
LYAAIEVGLCLVLFAASAMHVRWRLQHAAMAAQTQIAQTNQTDETLEPKPAAKPDQA